jgi:hypothetical protein
VLSSCVDGQRAGFMRGWSACWVHAWTAKRSARNWVTVNRAVQSADLDRQNARIVGSNPIRGVDVCLRLSVLYCTVLGRPCGRSSTEC